MSFDDLVAPLSHVPLLAGLQMTQLTEMARRGEKLRYSPGDTLMRAGQVADGAFLILSTGLDRVGDSEGASERVPPGTLLAEIAMFVEHTCDATYVARERVYCLKLARAAMHAQMLEDASLIEHFQRRITDRVKQVAEQLRMIDSATEAGPAAVAGSGRNPQPSQQTKAAAAQPRFIAAPRAWR